MAGARPLWPYVLGFGLWSRPLVARVYAMLRQLISAHSIAHAEKRLTTRQLSEPPRDDDHW